MKHSNRIETFKDLHPEVLERISNSFQDSMNGITAAFKSLEPFFKRFAVAIKDFPESSKFLAETGWYMPVDFDFGTANHLASELQIGNVDIVNETIVTYFDAELIVIARDLIKKFPDRQAVLEASFNAHKTGNYYLSIPVFFAQAEGIAKELTAFRFFQWKDNRSDIRSWTDKVDSSLILNALIEPLKIKGPMRKKQDLLNPVGLNRHDVLHGDSVDYGDDKINSYKALSLLNYIGETVYMVKEHLDKDLK